MKFVKLPLFILAGMALSDAGVVFSSRVLGLDAKDVPASTQKIWVEKDKLCMVIQSAGKETRVIYRKDKDAVYLIDATAKSYTEMTRADVKKAGERLQEAREKMNEAMKNMPPEQKAMMEKMMGKMAPAATPVLAKTEYKKTGSSTVGSWKTNEYDGFRDGAKSSHLWIVDFGKLGITKDDFAVMKDLGDFFSSLKMDSQMDFVKMGETLPGFPVRTTTVGEDGKDRITTEVTEVKKEGIPASQFDIPTGFALKKFEIPDMNGGRESRHGGPHR